MHSNETTSMPRKDQQLIEDLTLDSDELTDELLKLVVGGLPRDKGDDRSQGCTETGGGIWDPYLFPGDI